MANPTESTMKTDKSTKDGILRGANLRGFLIVGIAAFTAANEFIDAHAAPMAEALGKEFLLAMNFTLVIGLAALIAWRGFLDTSTGKANDAKSESDEPPVPQEVPPSEEAAAHQAG